MKPNSTLEVKPFCPAYLAWCLHSFWFSAFGRGQSSVPPVTVYIGWSLVVQSDLQDPQHMEKPGSSTSLPS